MLAEMKGGWFTPCTHNEQADLRTAEEPGTVSGRQTLTGSNSKGIKKHGAGGVGTTLESTRKEREADVWNDTS